MLSLYFDFFSYAKHLICSRSIIKFNEKITFRAGYGLSFDSYLFIISSLCLYVCVMNQRRIKLNKHTKSDKINILYGYSILPLVRFTIIKWISLWIRFTELISDIPEMKTSGWVFFCTHLMCAYYNKTWCFKFANGIVCKLF